ncbi:MAG: 2,3-bisphosphoglycerate-independent phosphoglycerate mutase [Chloroflexota bacterium]
MDFDILKTLVKRDETGKIVLLVIDGLGGLPERAAGSQTSLEAARTPNLDALAARSICGLHEPVAPGITPGSGPAHLGLFGYDPLTYQVGRGVLSALGIDFDLQPGDVAARGNFATVDDAGRATDRRAGRIPTEKTEELCTLLRERVTLSGAQFFVQLVKEYRFLFVLRGEGLLADVNETDPLEVGERPLKAEAQSPEAEKTAALVRSFVEQTAAVLADREPANMVLLRGFSQLPRWPSMEEVYGLKGVAIAGYPMYRGVSKLLGMEALPASPSVTEEFDRLAQHWADYDFFFVHIKGVDSAGEDGDFDRKVALIEEADAFVPRILELEPDVLIVTGDHSTPARMHYHSWHPVPVLLWSDICRPDRVAQFGERACMAGGLGPRFPVTDLMPLALAHARRLDKFGA